MSSISPSITSVAETSDLPASGTAIYRDWKKDYNEFGKSSLDTLVEWMLDGSYLGENYEKYENKTARPGEAKFKTAYCEEINELLIKTGHVSRQSKSIMEQIRQIKNSFLDCHMMISSTGYKVNPINEDEHDVALKERVIKKFKYYYVLLPVFARRPSVSLAGVSSSEDPVEESSDNEFNKRQTKKLTEKGKKRDFSEAACNILEVMTKAVHEKSQRKAAKFEAKKVRYESELKYRKLEKKIQLLTLLTQLGDDGFAKKYIENLLLELED